MNPDTLQKVQTVIADTTQSVKDIIENSTPLTKTFFDASTWPFYLIGFATFLITVIENLCNPNKQMKKFTWYLCEFLYTAISIVLGISLCLAFGTSQSACWIVSILMGLVGSSIVRKIIAQKNEIAEYIYKKFEANKLKS